MHRRFAPLHAVSSALFLVSLAAGDEWTRHTIDASSQGADGVRLADVDGDGRVDIVTPWEEGGDVRVAFDRGTPSEGRWEVVTVGRRKQVEDAVALDLDGEGPLEIISAAEGKTRRLTLYQQVSSGQWRGRDIPESIGKEQYMFILPWPTRTGTAFISGGKQTGATISFWSCQDSHRASEPSTWFPNQLRDAGWIMSLRRSDMNNDGRQDLLFSDRKGPSRGVGWLSLEVTDDDVVLRETLIGGRENEPMFLTEADVDYDGDRDILVAAKDAGLLMYERLADDGSKWRERRLALPPTAGSGKGVAVDTSGGRSEVFVSCEHSQRKCSIVRFVWNDGQTVFATEPSSTDCPTGTEGTKFDRLELIDMDGDGDRDLLTCEERENLGVIWYERPE